MNSQKSEEKPFVPNPNSKTPLTDEMMFKVCKLRKDEENEWDIEDAIDKFAIPTEKEDIVAMYFACKTNDFGYKREAVVEQMKLLFRNDSVVKGIIEDEEAKRKAREEALLEMKKKEARRKLTKISLIIAAIVIYVAILFVLCVK